MNSHVSIIQLQQLSIFTLCQYCSINPSCARHHNNPPRCSHSILQEYVTLQSKRDMADVIMLSALK